MTAPESTIDRRIERAAFTDAYERYTGSNRDTRAALWELCEATYSESQHKTIRQLSETIGRVDEDTVGGWAKVGWLIEYTDDHVYSQDYETSFTLHSMWHNADVFSYDHLLRVAKQAKRHELSPDEVLERLYNAMNGQTAESLERDIEEAHEPQAVLLRRDLKRIGKRLKQNIDSLEFRGASRRLVLAFRILERRMVQELKQLETDG